MNEQMSDKDNIAQLLNIEICRKCGYGHVDSFDWICGKYALKHSDCPVGDDVDEQIGILDECPYKMEHIVTMGEQSG